MSPELVSRQIVIKGERAVILPRETLRQILHSAPRHTLLYGPPGTGKTTEARRMANGSKVYSVTITDDTSAPELLGHFVPNEKGGFSWHHGPCARAWLDAALLILNEVDHACGGAEVALHAILDDPEVAMITMANGETISPQGGFRVIATMNGDPLGLTPALRDRFPIRILVDDISEEALKLLPKSLQVFCKNVYANGTHDRFTFRQILAMSQLAKALVKQEGIQAAVAAEISAKAVFGEGAPDVLYAAALAKEK